MPRRGIRGDIFSLPRKKKTKRNQPVMELALQVPPNPSRFHSLLQELLEEHEKQQSLLRSELERLRRSGPEEDPDRFDEDDVPSERREDDVLALTCEAPLDSAQLEECVIGSQVLPTVLPLEAEKKTVQIDAEKAEEEEDKRKVKVVAFSSETSQGGRNYRSEGTEVETPKSTLENKVFLKRDAWQMTGIGMEEGQTHRYRRAWPGWRFLVWRVQITIDSKEVHIL
eukprot:g31369.t1